MTQNWPGDHNDTNDRNVLNDTNDRNVLNDTNDTNLRQAKPGKGGREVGSTWKPFVGILRVANPAP